MPNSPDFVTHALDLLAGVGSVEVRAMFGGHGVYARGVMFGLLDDDELFLKTDEASRPRFVEAGCRRWVYVGPTSKMENTSYFRPPDEAHEDPEAMLAWAALALESALRLRAAKPARRPRGPAKKSPGKKAPGKGGPRKGAAAPPKRERAAPERRRSGEVGKPPTPTRPRRGRPGRRPR